MKIMHRGRDTAFTYISPVEVYQENDQWHQAFLLEGQTCLRAVWHDLRTGEASCAITLTLDCYEFVALSE